MLTNLQWMRILGDTIFAFGAAVRGWVVLGLIKGHSLEPGSRVIEEGQYTIHEPELLHHGD